MMVNDGDKIRTRNLCVDTILNHDLSKKFKLIKKSEFNHLINILTVIMNEIRAFLKEGCCYI
jgi:hypothetical protein